LEERFTGGLPPGIQIATVRGRIAGGSDRVLAQSLFGEGGHRCL